MAAAPPPATRLWMSVPVVSFIGKTAVSAAVEHSFSNAGLPELAVPSEEEYIQIACGLASDLPRLARTPPCAHVSKIQQQWMAQNSPAKSKPFTAKSGKMVRTARP